LPEAVLEVDRLRKVFELPSTFGRRRDFVAVDDVSFSLSGGGSLAVVGESGSGKTTVVRMLLGLERPTSGRIVVAGRERSRPARSGADRRRRGREMQIVFQDPYSSLDPRQTGEACLDEVLRFHFEFSRADRGARVAELGQQVGLGKNELRSLPHRLSGGQRQRLAIARALAAAPEVLALDEAVSALDVSVQAQVLNLLIDIREKTGISYVFVSHDLAVVRLVTEQVIVMQDGRVVERGPTLTILDAPQHPYTKLLRDSVPGPGWQPRRRSR
jgi:ABC-type glutathione transport system ATPase component